MPEREFVNLDITHDFIPPSMKFCVLTWDVGRATCDELLPRAPAILRVKEIRGLGVRKELRLSINCSVLLIISRTLRMRDVMVDMRGFRGS